MIGDHEWLNESEDGGCGQAADWGDMLRRAGRAINHLACPLASHRPRKTEGVRSPGPAPRRSAQAAEAEQAGRRAREHGTEVQNGLVEQSTQRLAALPCPCLI